MKPLQPSHTQLLINTAWGLDAAAIDKAAAKARGLVKWKGRWVTREERKQLKAEHYAYSGIRAVGVLGLLGGLATAATIFGPTSLLGKAWGLVAAATILISSGQILAYQSLGRPLLLGILFLDFLMMLVGVAAGTTPIWLPGVRLLFLALFASYLYNRNARLIFGPPATAPVPSPTPGA